MSDLNVEAVRSFILSRGGKVTNHELVKHFKAVLTNPQTRDEARIKFKEIVNTVATITRDAEGGKQLTLRKKYRTGSEASVNTLPPDLNLQYTPVYHSPTTDYGQLSRRASQDSLFASITFKSPLPASPLPGTPLSGVFMALPTPTYSNPPSVPGTPPMMSQHHGGPVITPMDRRDSVSSLSSAVTASSSISGPQITAMYPSTERPTVLNLPHPLEPPPPLPPQQIASYPSSPEESSSSADPPPVPPRRRSSDKIRQDFEDSSENKENIATTSAAAAVVGGEDSKISVKERSQKFDRMASEVALNKAVIPSKKRPEKADRDEEDGGVHTFDAKSREWIVRCAQGNYQPLAKLITDNPKLIRFKDPANGYTALHWAAKHGSEDLVKLFAGTHAADVNARTNGGYTPLHIAMQFGHEEVFSLLTEVYGADQNLRDYSGKKPHQYQTQKGTTVSVDTFRKIKARKKHAEKDLGFLRIGSLNVRVKKTTEAFSHFLGVGVGNPEKIHKNWGSADNLPQGDSKKMPPPKFAPIKKRKSKRGSDFGIRNSVVEDKPDQQDSDSDAGFGSSWQSTV